MPLNLEKPYDHHLNPSKGWPSEAPLDHVAKQSANVLYSLRAGQCAHLNSAGELEPGVQLGQMGLFLFQGKDSYDVSTASDDVHIPVTPSGNIMCVVAKAAVELETTEFVGSLTYAPNDYLRSPVGNAASAEALSGTPARPTTASSGVLRNDTITLYTTAIVGVVSRGVFTNYNSRQMLAFWPVYLPGTA